MTADPADDVLLAEATVEPGELAISVEEMQRIALATRTSDETHPRSAVGEHSALSAREPDPN